MYEWMVQADADQPLRILHRILQALRSEKGHSHEKLGLQACMQCLQSRARVSLFAR